MSTPRNENFSVVDAEKDNASDGNRKIEGRSVR